MVAPNQKVVITIKDKVFVLNVQLVRFFLFQRCPYGQDLSIFVLIKQRMEGI